MSCIVAWWWWLLLWTWYRETVDPVTYYKRPRIKIWPVSRLVRPNFTTRLDKLLILAFIEKDNFVSDDEQYSYTFCSNVYSSDKSANTTQSNLWCNDVQKIFSLFCRIVKKGIWFFFIAAKYRKTNKNLAKILCTYVPSERENSLSKTFWKALFSKGRGLQRF